MKRKKVKLTKLVIDKLGNKFIPISQCGIPPTFCIIDGVPITRFGREKSVYISLDIAMKWYEKELGAAKKYRYSKEEVDVIRNNMEFIRDLNKGEKIKNE